MQFPARPESAAVPGSEPTARGVCAEADRSLGAAAEAAAPPVLRLHRDAEDLLDALAPAGRGLLLRDRAA